MGTILFGIFTITLGILLGIFILIKVISSIVFKLMAGTMQGIKDRYGEQIEYLEEGVNFCGEEPHSGVRIRGNGSLLLLQEQFVFEMWAPQKTVQIPLNKIINIERVKSFAGRRGLTPILKVTFKDDSNQEKTMGWLVKEIDEWEKRLSQSR